MDLKNNQQLYPEDIQQDYFVYLKDIEKTQEISFKRQLANGDFEDRTIEFLIPECIEKGTRLRMKKEGHIGRTNIGNLYLTIHILFKGVRSQNGNAYTFKYINPFQRKFKSNFDINFSNEVIRVKIPKNIKNGQILRLKGQGYQNIGSNHRGNLYIKIIIKKPEQYLHFFSDFFIFIFLLLNRLKNKISKSIKNYNHNSNNNNSFNTNYNNNHNIFNEYKNNRYNWDNNSFNNLNNNNADDNTEDNSNSPISFKDDIANRRLYRDPIYYTPNFMEINEKNRGRHSDEKYCRHDDDYCVHDKDYPIYFERNE